MADGIAALLLDGRLAPGIRLPSERELATVLSISRATATSAYDELAAGSLLVRRRGAGSFLRLPSAAQVTGPGSRMARNSREAGTLDLSIASLPALPGIIEAATAQVAELVGAYARADGYHPYGITQLREAVAEHYRKRGVPTTVEQVLITNGAQHGFDLALRALAMAGDRVLTELPSYPGALEAIKAHSARAVAVPMDFHTGGWDTVAMGSALLQSSPRLAYLMPDFHNPTGALIGTEQRERVARSARRSGTRIVVDESFVEIDLRQEADTCSMPVPMAGLDSSVISLGSLSKPIWGGLRVGWIRADSETVQRLAVARARGDMAGAVIEQLIASTLFEDLAGAVAVRRKELAAQRDVLLAELARQLSGWQVTPPAGGLSAWVELDAPAATALTHRLEQKGVLLSPGSRFALDGMLERFLRIPFALQADQLVRAVGLIAETWRELDTAQLAGRRPSSLVTA